jgi:hypothetical protein
MTPMAAAIGQPSFASRVVGSLKGAYNGWFGPQTPLQPIAPPEVKGRQYDYPFGANLQYLPRAQEGVSFQQLRDLADSLPILRLVIETRKDQIAGLNYVFRPIQDGTAKKKKVRAADDPASIRVQSFMKRPDRRHTFPQWLRMLSEDLLVTDAATIYPRLTRGGGLYSADIIDGATISPMLGEDGRSPMPPDPAYQQILHGVVAADFTSDELMYRPRNVRVHKRGYGYSQVEQIILTVNIALRRDVYTLNYYKEGSVPDAFGTLPKEWTNDQIRGFQDYFDAMMSGDLAARRRMKFMPGDFHLIEARQPPLKDQYDEWLARLVCYAYSVPVTPFVATVNRATSETLRVQASQEGIGPIKLWLKDLMDDLIQNRLGEKDVEFAFDDGDETAPLERAQTLVALVGAGIKSRDEARDELGDEAIPGGAGAEFTITTGAGLAPITLPEPGEMPPGGAPTSGQPPKPGANPGAPPAISGQGGKPTPALNAAQMQQKADKPMPAAKSAPARTLYVHRPLTNAEPLIAWAKANGFSTTLPTDDMHATIAYSRAPVDWNSVPVDPVKGLVVGDGDRALAKFGKAVVLKFDSDHLQKRHVDLEQAGASWDHPEYQPHVTLSYDADDVDLDAVAPFDGELHFGPENWGEVKANAMAGVVEKQFNPSQPRAPNGKWTSGSLVTIADDEEGRRPLAAYLSTDTAEAAHHAAGEIYEDSEPELHSLKLPADAKVGDTVHVAFTHKGEAVAAGTAKDAKKAAVELSQKNWQAHGPDWDVSEDATEAQRAKALTAWASDHPSDPEAKNASDKEWNDYVKQANGISADAKAPYPGLFEANDYFYTEDLPEYAVDVAKTKVRKAIAPKPAITSDEKPSTALDEGLADLTN